MSRKQKNVKWVVGAAVAAAIASAVYKIYKSIENDNSPNKDNSNNSSHNDISSHNESDSTAVSTRYTLKKIALTLSHTILTSDLPLNEILLHSENVTFILPPNLLLDDLASSIDTSGSASASTLLVVMVEESQSLSAYSVPRTLVENYKLLRCSNIHGYFNILKNLQPDMLLICLDDLGITKDKFPQDIGRFIKEIISLDQDKLDVSKKLSPIFFT
ncbi:uncharacterized protein KQ657_001430 [Scheffersomyces spartinae]|uniref:Peroxisome assembly protein 22 n=1 Tax=Scheffersomyces spartinae TaxID=45513 RepID=A0A9P7V779_9ASCO|nr:uncharacterized protein KQ657_001430 [Scheffersomyces spartinae]KAG7192650.1 hypothetical protein KQ657_001430 [Scheffersomyces spartinae]